MFRHIVLMRFTPESDPAEIEAALTQLRALPGRIPEIVRYEVGLDPRHRETNYHLAIVGDFASYEDFLVYRDHPEHVAASRELGRHRETSSVAQYERPGPD